MKNNKNKKYHYIYKTTCLITNRYYIGMHSTDKIDDGYIGSGKRLWNSIKYHGRINHITEIIEYLNNRDELKNRECEIVNSFLLKDILCMNLTIGGEGGYVSEYGVKKGREKCDIILREKYGDDFRSIVVKNYHQKLTISEKEEWINKIKIGQIGMNRSHFLNKKHTEETKSKISEKLKITSKGEKNSQYGTCWITKEGINKKIKIDELYFYIENNWIKGRKLK